MPLHTPPPPPEMGLPEGVSPARPAGVDPVAWQRQQRRWARAAEGPWLHAEMARRMAPRLAWWRQPPSAWWEWEAWVGQSGPALAEALPQGERWVLEPEAWARSRWTTPAPIDPGWRRWLPAAWRPVPPARVAADGGRPPVSVRGRAEGDGPTLLWANAVLHRHAQPQALLAEWHRCLPVNGVLMFSTLGPGTLAELRSIHAEQGWGPAHQPFVDMHDWGDALVQAGFADPVMDQETLTLSWASPEQAWRELSTWGVNAHPLRTAGCRGRAWKRAWCDALQARSTDPQGRVQLSVELVYGQAVKPPPRHALAPVTSVSLEALRAELRQPARRAREG